MKYWEKTFPIRVSECDVNNGWRPGAILTELQEAAGHHSAAVSCSREALLALDLAWVVVRLDLRMSRYPVSGETVTVKTFHRPARHRFFPRFFEIRDGSGAVIGQASSLWLLMDLKTRQSVAADRLPVPLPDNSDMPELIPLPGQIPVLSGPERIIPLEPRFTDLDPNGHVNNTKYADWLCDALGIETMMSHRLSDLNIHFNAEVRPGQSLSLHLRESDGRVQLLGLHGETAAFEIGAVLVPVSP